LWSWQSFAIITNMVLRSAKVKRSLAVTLVTCFVWVFIACVAICSAHSAEKQTQCPQTITSSVCCEDDSTCCPITSALPSVLPDTSMLLVNDRQTAVMRYVEPTPLGSLSKSYTSFTASRAAPPFDRLPSLRI